MGNTLFVQHIIRSVFYSAVASPESESFALTCSYVRTRISSRETETERLSWWWRRSPEGLGVGVVSARHMGQLVLPRSHVSMKSAWK
jgi:hypothetical protein